MKKIVYILISLVLLASCQKPEPDSGKTPAKSYPGYKELLEAYDAGKVFKEVQASAEVNVVVFEDGSKINVPVSSFMIHDHTKTPAPIVEVETGMQWWSVGGQMTGIKALPSVTSREDSEPVYVYYDKKTLYMHLSNRDVLKFVSHRLTPEEELERRQNIPVIYIDTRGAAIRDKENYVDGTITVCDPERLYSDVEEFSAPMGIRGRGNTTWSFPKKPWKVKLKEKASVLGLPPDKEWCLLANYSDRTLLRNLTAMHLSEICGFPWTPRMYSVEVYLNNEYQGVYNFCEHKKVSHDRVNINVDQGDVYLEIEEMQDETTCWWTGMGVPMMFSDPEEPSGDQFTKIKQMFDDFEKALRNKDYSIETGYPKYIDVDSFIDYFIVQEIAKNVDGNLRKSSFITIENGGKMVMYHLWDFDLTFGNALNFGTEVGYGYENFYIRRDRWYPYLFKDPAFVDRLQDRWAELYPELMKVPEYIRQQALYLDKAKDRNFVRWSIHESVGLAVPSKGTYERELEYFVEFYKRRLGWLNVEINKL